MSEGTTVSEANPLIRAVVHSQQTRKHTVADLACALGTSPSHWYRLRRNPSLIARCRKPTLDSIAEYIGWPWQRVYAAAIGTFVESWSMEHARTADILSFIGRSEYSTGLKIPLDQAAPDHQALVIHLFCAHQVAVAWIAAYLKDGDVPETTSRISHPGRGQAALSADAAPPLSSRP